MGKSDPQTRGSEPGRAADESASTEREVEGGDPPVSEDEQWGFTDKKGGMASETKAGIAIVVLLLGAFGFIVFNKYGRGLKKTDIAQVSPGETDVPPADESVEQVVPPAQEIPSAFEPQEPAATRVAAYEQDFLAPQGEQTEPAGVMEQPDPWGGAPQQAAVNEPPPPAANNMAFADQQPEALDAFDDLMGAAPAAQLEPSPTQQPAPAQAQYAPQQFDETADPFGDAAAATPMQQAPAAVADLDDAWGPAPAPASQPDPVAATEFNPMDAGFNSDPFGDPTAQAAPAAAPERVDSAPMDPFGDAGFDAQPQPLPQQQVQTQPVDSRFAPDEFGPAPTPAPREPATIAQYTTEPMQVVSQPTVKARDPFEMTDPGVDFNSAPAARTEFDPAPTPAPAQPVPQRYDRGEVRQTDRVFDGQAAPFEKDDFYTIQSSDTYWSISKKVYGTSRYYRALAKYNQTRIPDPRRMQLGAKLMVPSRAVLESRYPQMFPSARNKVAAASADSRRPAGLYVDSDNRPVYRVGSKDSLGLIAQKHLGRASRWSEIYDLNRSQLNNETTIRPGMLLAMPADASQVSRYR